MKEGKKKMIMEGVRTLGLLATTAGFAYLTYLGAHSFIDVIRGVSHLTDAVSDLENYVTNYSAQSLEQAVNHVTVAREYLTAHAHIFPFRPDANELTDVINKINSGDTQKISQEAIPHINDVSMAYSGPGNCPIAKILAPGGATMVSEYFAVNGMINFVRHWS